MAAWAKSVAPAGADRVIVATLAHALVTRGWRHRDHVTLTAREAYDRREGDCVSFALTLVALARARGVPARLAVREPATWVTASDLEVAAGHMVVGLDHGSTLLVFDSLGEDGEEAGTFRPLSDAQALGIFHANRGAGLLLADSLEDSVRELEKAVAAAPDLPSAWVNLGVALRRAGREREAEGAYRQALRLAPRSASAWRNLALLLETRTEGALP
jgi:tetratricopeptide (TPR) repeat protein